MPTPKEGESRTEYVERCIVYLFEHEGETDRDYAFNKCNGMYNQHIKEKKDNPVESPKIKGIPNGFFVEYEEPEFITPEKAITYEKLVYIENLMIIDPEKARESIIELPLHEFKLYEENQKRIANDAIEGNINKVRKSVMNAINKDKDSYKLIVDKYIDEAFASGVREVEKELSKQPFEIFNTDKTRSTRDVLKTNAVVLVNSLLDDITKEVNLMLTDIELHGIKFTTPELKKEVQAIFTKKAGRLMSQVTTETTRATNTGLQWGYKEEGVITHKQWIAVLDDKTTSVCRNGNGEIREIGEPFSTGDYGAPFHINCRSRIQGLTISEVEKMQ